MRGVALIAWLAGPGCKGAGSAQEEPGPAAASPGVADPAPAGAAVPSGALVTDEEIRPLRDALDTQIAENRARRCPAPPLRGDGLPGAADEDIEAVLRPTRPDLVRCAELAVERGDELRAWLDAGGPAPEPVAAALEACAPLEAAVHAAASHSDSCSPYLAGRRGMPRLLRALAVGRALDGRARLLQQAGRSEDALALGFDWMRVMQHISRGTGSPLVVAMVGTAAVRQTVETVISPVLGGVPLSEEVLADTERSLRLLLAGEPEFGDLIAYERAGSALNMMLPALEGPTWVPPGGFDEGHVPAPKGALDDPRLIRMPGVDDRQTMMLAWIAFDRTTRRMEEACPPAASLDACRQALKALATAPPPARTRPVLGRWLSVAMADDPRAAVRDQILEILEDIAAPSYWRHVDRLALRRFTLAALRVHVAALRAQASEGACPGAAALAGGAWAAQLLIPGLAEPLEVDDVDGETVLSAPPALRADAGDSARYVLRCPAQ